MSYISRQAAIANINKAIPEWSEDKEIAIDCLKNTPSLTQMGQELNPTYMDCVSRQAAIDALAENRPDVWTDDDYELGMKNQHESDIATINALSSAQPEITDEQAIEHLRSTGWMQNHDREMYDMGLKEQLADDSDSYDALLPSAQPKPQWIPVKFRPMDSEEREYWEEQFGEELADEDAVMFDCPMPEDGQEILVSYRKWISMDKCEIDGGCYGLEGNGDWEDVAAWMPLPEPYKEERKDDGEIH